jgi:hypothetical protein
VQTCDRGFCLRKVRLIANQIQRDPDCADCNSKGDLLRQRHYAEDRAFATRARSDALALVRDDAVWSQLAPSNGPGERFRIFRFHFPEGIDNSGFVGWLASRLKLEFGTGVFVTCGQNSGDGGIFDYWGVPEMLGDVVTAYVSKLCANDPDLAQGRRGQ